MYNWNRKDKEFFQLYTISFYTFHKYFIRYDIKAYLNYLHTNVSPWLQNPTFKYGAELQQLIKQHKSNDSVENLGEDVLE